jgi:putative peptidoglycan lipid II flippase
MFPFLLCVSLAALLMGALNTKKVFFVPALAPAMLNVTLIVSIVFFESRTSQPIIVAAIGVLAGGFVQFAFQLPSFFRNGYRLGLSPFFRHPGLRKMTLLLVPATLALSVSQVNIIVSSIFASFLPQGGITYLFYSMRLIQFPVGIFGVAMGMAVLPTLSEHAVKGEMDRLREDFSFALRLLFFIAVPCMAGLIALREPIVNLLFQRGQFDYAATQGTADALLFYSLGIWSVVGVRVVTAAFYSMQDTKVPVKIAVVGMLTNIFCSFALMGPMKHSGLALAYAVASWVNFSLLFFFLRKKLGRVDARKILGSFSKTVISSVAMGLIGWGFLRGEIWQQSGNSPVKAAYLTGTIVMCVGIYMTSSYLLKNEEISFVYRELLKKFKKKGRL